MEKSPLYRHPAMRLLKKAILREVYFQIAATGLLLLFGLTLLLLQLNGSIFLSVIGLGTMVFSGFFIYKSIPALDLEMHPLYRTLMDEPEQIVWVYSLATQRMPFGLEIFKSGIVYLYLADGGHYSVSLPVRKLKLACKFLSRLLPHASVGYTPERAEKFQFNPKLLKRRPR